MRFWSLLVIPVATSLVLIACGSSNSTGPGSDAGTVDSTNGNMDATFGGDTTPYDAGGPCKPKTCMQLGFTCGKNSDGCGNLIDCGACMSPQFCGGGGFSKCGGTMVGADGSGIPPCMPKTCSQLMYNCGKNSDGCGNILDCGTCPSPQFCGGGGYSVCGGNTNAMDSGGNICMPKTCMQLGYNCGPADDGCGNMLDCGTCMSPQFCGGGGFSLCGGNMGGQDGGAICQPATCMSLGFNCGPAGDGCGNLLACGNCVPPFICGGGGIPGQCGDSNLPDGGDAAACTGLCGQIPVCDAGTTTTVSGRIYAPTDPTAGYGQPDPIQHAHVFIPNDPSSLTGFGNMVACACDTASGPAIATTYSAIDGSFTLTNVPAGNNIPIVIQLGRWRRVYYTNIAPCQPNVITDDAMCQAGGTCNTRLPRKQQEFNQFDNIPLIAEVTGSADPIECVLPKLGIDLTQFSNPGGTGRVQFYHANGATYTGGGTPNESQLWSSAATLEGFDMVILDCEGGEHTENAAPLANVQAYANAGGRVFASHYSYVWTFTNDPWGCGGEANNGNPTPPTATCTTSGHTVADWFADQPTPTPDPINAVIDDPTMLAWLSQPLINVVGAGNTIQLGAPRQDTTGVIPPNAMGFPATQLFLHADPNQSPNNPLEFTWNSPPFAPPNQQCGRVLFSDFHVNTGGAGTGTFPGECPVSVMTPQEKVLEFMLFDLGDCVQTIKPPPPPTCNPLTCAQQNIFCGPAGDGCGHLLNCGMCTPPATCGGGGVHGQCGYIDGSSCMPKTCAQQGFNCGPAGDGCGNGLNCGMCTPPNTCGGGGMPGVCGFVDGGSCMAKTCAQLGFNCGPAGDGCGGLLSCGMCTPPQTCGGGGMPGVCGAFDGGTCVPLTCAQQNIMCGPAGDGCGNLLDCGTCTPPQTCGGGGTPGVCGGGMNH